MGSADHYTIISADCHGGGSTAEYREYLEAKYHEAYDEWLDLRSLVPVTCTTAWSGERIRTRAFLYGESAGTDRP